MSRPMWIPLEASPDVFNSYASSLGFSTDSYCFTDIWGLDPDLLAFVPRPVKAVLLLFPTTEARYARNKTDDAKGDLVLGSEVDDLQNGGTLWIPQTIGNACGTMGMLHALANAGVEIPEDAPLKAFFDDCRKVSPAERTALLSTSPLLAKAHTSAASAGQTILREEDAQTPLHFLAFVEGKGKDGSKHIIELDGGRPGPIDRGVLETDLLTDVAKFVKDDFMANDPTSDSFSLIALAPVQKDD